MKVLVCGGRNFNDRELLYQTMNDLSGISLVIEGGAKGADTLAGEWAHKKQIPYLVVPAEWNKYGKSAGYLRNAKMLTYKPDLVIAFPGGAGTAMMVRIAKKAEIRVVEVNDNDPVP